MQPIPRAWLKMLADKKLLTMEEAMLIIENYIHERKGVTVQINGEVNIELFEKAITIACNYYA